MGLGVGFGINGDMRVALIKKWRSVFAQRVVDEEKLREFVHVWRRMFPVASSEEIALGNDSDEGEAVIRLVRGFSHWQFDESNPNATDLRTKFLELSRLLENLHGDGANGLLGDMNRIGGGNLTLEKLDLAMDLLADAIGEKQFILEFEPESSKSKNRKERARTTADVSAEKVKSTTEGVARAKQMKAQLNDLFKSASNHERLIARVNQFMQQLEVNRDSLDTLSKELVKLLRSKSGFTDADGISVATALLHWADTTLVVVQMADLIDTDRKIVRLLTNGEGSRLYHIYSSSVNNNPTERRPRQNLGFLKDINGRVKSDRSSTLRQLGIAKGKLAGWDISTPLPVRNAGEVEIVDLDALTGDQSDSVLGQLRWKHGGFYSGFSLLVGILVPALVIVLFLPGVSFAGVDLGGFIGGSDSFMSVVDNFQGFDLGLRGLGGTIGSVGAAVGGRLPLISRLNNYFEGLKTNSAEDMFKTGLALIGSVQNPGEIKTVRDELRKNGMLKSSNDKLNIRTMMQLQRIAEIRMVLADVKKLLFEWQKGIGKKELTRETAEREVSALVSSWLTVPRYDGEKGAPNSRISGELAPFHEMGRALLVGVIGRLFGEEVERSVVKDEIARVDLAVSGLFKTAHLKQFKYVEGAPKKVLDLEVLVENGSSSGISPLFQKASGTVETVALFGVDLLSPILRVAVAFPKPSKALKMAFSKFQIDQSGSWWVPGKGVFVLTATEIRSVIKAAGFAVLRDDGNAHKAAIAKVLREIRLFKVSGAPEFIDRVHVLETKPGVSLGINENEFAFFVRDVNGKLNIYVHRKTLDQWKERGNPYYFSALRILLYHEWAESFGVSHENLVKMGLTVDGLDKLIQSGATEADIQWEIRARGMLALGMLVPDPRILDVDARKNAEAALETLIPTDIPWGVETYVTGVYQVPADRGTWAHRVAYELRGAIPGYEKDTAAQAISGAPNEKYEAFFNGKEENEEGLLEAVRLETERLLAENKNIRDELALDILARVFQMLRSHDWGNFEVSAPTIAQIKKELAILHHTGGSLFLSLSRRKDSDRAVSPGVRRLYQERDLAWLDQLPFLKNRVTSPTPEKADALRKSSVGYDETAKAAHRLAGAFAALDESLLDESTTPVLRISDDLLAGLAPLTGPQWTALHEVTALARRAEQDAAVAAQVVFLVDNRGGQVRSTADILRELEARTGIVSGSLQALSGAHVVSNDSLFNETNENGRTVRTYHAARLFERVKQIGISAKRVDIYAVPPTDTLAEVWDISGLDAKAGLVLRLIELWAGDVAERVSSEFGKEFRNRMEAVRTAA